MITALKLLNDDHDNDDDDDHDNIDGGNDRWMKRFVASLSE